MRRTQYYKALVGFTVMALLGLTFFPARVMAQQETGGVTLRPGIVIHPNLNVAYAMTPEGIAAVDIGTGAKRWTTREAAKPLAIKGSLLISQAEPRVARNRLEVVALNTQERGTASVRGTTQLPTGIWVSVAETLEGKFEVEARPSPNDVLIIWNFERAPIRGIADEADEDKQASDQRLFQTQITGGSYRMSLTTGTITQLNDSLLRIKPPQQLMLASSAKISDAASAQFESADGRHVLASEPVGDDRVWDKYRWTVYERSSGRRVGEFRTHISFAPFVVRDSVLVYETTPFVRRGAGEEPAKLRGVNLSTGREVWGIEVREIVYRGPFPP